MNVRIDFLVGAALSFTFAAMKVQKKLALGYFKTKLNLLSLVNKQKAGEEAFKLFCTPFLRYQGPEAPVFKDAEKLTFQLDGKKIIGYRCNHPQQKKVLLLHGFSSTCHRFDKYAEALIKKGYEVLAFDAPAHGGSDGKTVNAVEYSDMIKQIVQLYGPVDAFIAHSFGGIAVSLALESLPHSSNTKVVLIAPATETESAINGAFALLGINNKVLRQGLDEAIYKREGRNTSWYSIRRAMKNITASVLWLHDEEDDITPWEDAKKVQQEALPNIEFVFTKGLGHQRIYRDADVRKRILEFL